MLWCHCILWLCVCRCHNREKNIPLTSKWTMASAVLVSPFSIYDLNMAWTGSADMLILAHLDISDGADAFQTSDSRSKYGSMISSVVLSVCLYFLFKASEYRVIDLRVTVLVREWVLDQMDGEDWCSVRIQDVSISLQMLTCDHHRHRNSYCFALMLDCLGLQLWSIHIPFF